MKFILVMRLFGLLMLLHLLVLQNVIFIEGALCETPSKTFRGLCFISKNCVLVCEREGFTSGKCQGFRHRCICAKDCGSGIPSAPPGGGGGGGDPDTPPGDGGDGGEDPGTPGGGDGGEEPGTPEGLPEGGDPDTPPIDLIKKL